MVWNNRACVKNKGQGVTKFVDASVEGSKHKKSNSAVVLSAQHPNSIGIKKIGAERKRSASLNGVRKKFSISETAEVEHKGVQAKKGSTGPKVEVSHLKKTESIKKSESNKKKVVSTAKQNSSSSKTSHPIKRVTLNKGASRIVGTKKVEPKKTVSKASPQKKILAKGATSKKIVVKKAAPAKPLAKKSVLKKAPITKVVIKKTPVKNAIASKVAPKKIGVGVTAKKKVR